MVSDTTNTIDPEKVYYSTDELTLDTEDGPQTLKLGGLAECRSGPHP